MSRPQRASSAQATRSRAQGRAARDRYRRGARRTSAEPLAAAWHPDTGEAAAERTAEPARRGVRGILGTYGWRVYALPVLVVITVLVLVRTGGTDAPPQAQPTPDNGVGTETAQPPQATEQPPTPADLTVPTANLPDGGQFTKHGKGTWHLIPGTTKKVGTGRLYTYTVEAEDGIDAASYGGDDAFAKLVDDTLADPRSWAGDGTVAVQRVDPKVTAPDIRISLTTPDTTHRPDYCGDDIHYESSCWRRSQGRVVINLARWVRGATAFSGDMGTYRQYAINHEIGHAFGNGHVGCNGNGELAPVMMQQSFGVADDYVAKLNQVDPTNKTAVAADHKVCKPNAWPNPQAK